MSAHTFFAVPEAPAYALRHVRIPACLTTPTAQALTVATTFEHGDLHDADLMIEDGCIAAILPAGTAAPASGPDLRQSMVLPGLLDCHTHLDKGHIWPRKPNPTGDGAGAAQATGEDRTARWREHDLLARMSFGLQTAYAHGVLAIRTHLDCLQPQADISFPVFQELREAWQGRIDLQASSIAPLDIFLTDEGRRLADTVARAGGQLGCVTRFRGLPNVPLQPEFDVAIRRFFELAAERGLDADLHVDETGDARVLSLAEVARIATEVGFAGRILCGHCCSLALQDEARIARTLDACARAGIDFVSLPTVNLYLQDRDPTASRTPRWRGVTLLHEMKARGLRVAIAGDNCRDPFHAYGDHDMLDTYTQAVKILHLDHPLGHWIEAATRTPADIMGLPQRGRLAPGLPADLLVLRARNYSELLARHQSDRVVLRQGRAIDTRLPDYRLLDELMT
ncbi:cytosine deaminase [Verticiella sediminum]|uniref:Cytosine deaminase n=1 Tax=Verticiella sediminum TaxID=1247510 RepID=A0A556AZL9_9BURK|nr:cytosine deaminase [Verticiella sediminum]TSH98383.1 cytosine deaminase [Verticiella sediminum]